MYRWKPSLALLLWTGAASVQAAGGLVPPAAEAVWPQWQARVSLQTADVTPLGLTRRLDAGNTQRGLLGGAILGDYYFARPSFGNFRASGGLMVGAQGGLPIGNALAGQRLGVSLSSGLVNQAVPGTESGSSNHSTVPYLGLGYSSAPWRNGLAISADLGLVAGRGSALFGNQGLDGSLRELRLLPVLQLGVSYAF